MTEPQPEILAAPPPDLPESLGPYRQADYDQLADGQRRQCELVLGRFYALHPPSVLHQTVVQQLWRHLKGIAHASGGRAYLGPVDVRLADHSVVKPDVFYLTAEHGDRFAGGMQVVPDLIAEVLSPESALADRREKRALYAQSRVVELWLVDPERHVVEVCVLEDGSYVVERLDTSHTPDRWWPA